MLALMELDVSIYDFFDGQIYEQRVKTKTKENVIEIINSQVFFDTLAEKGVRKKNTAHENLQKFLSLDPNYPELMMLKKIAKAMDEMAKSEELMSGIVAAAQEAEQDRLGTIGEEGGDGQTYKDSAKEQIVDEYEKEQFEDKEESDYEF